MLLVIFITVKISISGLHRKKHNNIRSYRDTSPNTHLGIKQKQVSFDRKIQLFRGALFSFGLRSSRRKTKRLPTVPDGKIIENSLPTTRFTIETNQTYLFAKKIPKL